MLAGALGFSVANLWARAKGCSGSKCPPQSPPTAERYALAASWVSLAPGLPGEWAVPRRLPWAGN